LAMVAANPSKLIEFMVLAASPASYGRADAGAV
jgi:hypothetical protein